MICGLGSDFAVVSNEPAWRTSPTAVLYEAQYLLG